MKHNIPRYACQRGLLDQGEPRCIAFGGLRVDDAIAAALLQTVEPGAVAAAVEAEMASASPRSGSRGDDARSRSGALRRRARLPAYDAADPLNRLVAAELEARWNRALLRVGELEAKIAAHHDATPPPTALALPALATLADDLATAWRAPTTDARLKKRIVRTVIREVIADIDAEGGAIMLLIHWMGGVHTELRLPRRRRGQRNSTSPGSSTRVRQLVLSRAMT